MFQFQNQLIHNESTFKGTDSNSIDMSLAIEPAGIYLQMPGSIVQTFELFSSIFNLIRLKIL